MTRIDERPMTADRSAGIEASSRRPVKNLCDTFGMLPAEEAVFGAS
jgi:hypothetical protein